MISDALSECVHEMDRYLNDPLYARVYGDAEPMLRRIRDDMEAMRKKLDSPPNVTPDLPDMIAWSHGTVVRLFPTSERGLHHLMASPSFARYGVPVVTYGGVDATKAVASQYAKTLNVGECVGAEIATTLDAVCKWRSGGQSTWLPF